MLAKQPDERYQTAGDLLLDLRGLQADELSIDAASGTEEWTTPEQIALADAREAATQPMSAVMRNDAVLQRRRSPLMWTAAGCVAAVLLGGLVAPPLARPRCWPSPPSTCRGSSVKRPSRTSTTLQRGCKPRTLGTACSASSSGGKTSRTSPTRMRIKQRLAELYRIAAIWTRPFSSTQNWSHPVGPTPRCWPSVWRDRSGSSSCEETRKQP